MRLTNLLQLKLYSYDQHSAWFEREHAKLLLDPGTSVCGPVFDDLGDQPEVAPWRTDFALIFSDMKYVRVTENFGETKQAHGGMGRRNHFAFHYGDCNGQMDSDGFPEMIDQVDLRIDRQPGAPAPDHIHYQGQDHIPSELVSGLDFESITPFDFVGAVLEHRRSGASLHQLLGFTVEATT